MSLDGGKTLEVLKDMLREGGWIKTAIAAACGFFLLIARWGWVPPLDPWMIQAATFGLLLFGFLASASFITAAHRFFPLDKWAAHWINIHREKVGLAKLIPYLTPKEREIIGYLLVKKQKTFLAAADGGYAVSLVSRGIVVIVARPGQQLDLENVPMTIPDHLWDVLMQHKVSFPYAQPDDEEEPEPHPWRIHWMARRIR